MLILHFLLKNIFEEIMKIHPTLTNKNEQFFLKVSPQVKFFYSKNKTTASDLSQ